MVSKLFYKEPKRTKIQKWPRRVAENYYQTIVRNRNSEDMTSDVRK